MTAEWVGDFVTGDVKPCADTCVRKNYASNQQGGGHELFCEADSAGDYAARGWLKFCITGLVSELDAYFGSNAWVLDQLQLRLREYGGYSWDMAGPLDVYHESNDLWEEGQLPFSPAQGNEICWNNEACFVTNGSETLVTQFVAQAASGFRTIGLNNATLFADLLTNQTMSLRLCPRDNTKCVFYSKEFAEYYNPRLFCIAHWTGTATRIEAYAEIYDFEDSGAPAYSSTSWQWGMPTGSVTSFSGSNCWETTLNQPHPADTPTASLWLSSTGIYRNAVVSWRFNAAMASGALASADTYVDNLSARQILTNTSGGWQCGTLRFTNGVADTASTVFYFTGATNPANLRGVLIDAVAFGTWRQRGQGGVWLDKSLYRVPDAARIEVLDDDLNTNALAVESATLRVFSSVETTGLVVHLCEAGLDAPLFTGSVGIVSASEPAPAGAVSALAADVLRVEYADADNGFGVPQTKRAQATLDGLPPVISNVAISAITEQRALASWWASPDVSVTWLDWGTNPAYWSRVTVSNVHQFTALQPRLTYYFRLIAQDRAGWQTTNDNEGAWFSFATKAVFLPHSYEPCDRTPGWTVYNGEWMFGAPVNWPYRGASGTNCWATGIDRGYQNNANAILSPPLFPAISNAAVRFAHAFRLERNWDYGYCEVSGDGVNWSCAAAYTDQQESWSEDSIALPYDQYSAARWRMFSDGSVTDAGWFIDDVTFGSYADELGPYVTQCRLLWDYATDGDAELDLGETSSVAVIVHNFAQQSFSNCLVAVHADAGQVNWDPAVFTTAYLGVESVTTVGVARVLIPTNAAPVAWRASWWMVATDARVFTNLHLLPASAPAVTLRVAVRVVNAQGAPVPQAYVWIDPDDPFCARANESGVVTAELTRAKNYLLRARHPDYGRGQPVFSYIDSDTNITLALPAFTACRIATYNMKGFDPWSDTQARALARVLWTVQPDVLLAQETRDSALALSEFQTRYLLGYTMAQSPVGGNIHNAVLSLWPLTNQFSAGADVMTRDVFGAEVLLPLPWPGGTTLMSVHYKANKGVTEAATRDTEAIFTALYCSNLLALSHGGLVVLGGDMNEDIADATWLSHVHEILASNNTGLTRLDPRDDAGNPATYPSWDSRLDYLYCGSGFDHYLLTARVFRTDTLADLPAWLAAGDSATASDHALVFADIEMVPEAATALTLLVGLLVVRLHATRTTHE